MKQAYHKHLICRAALLCAAALSAAASASAASIEVRVGGVADTKGSVKVAICDREHFLKECVYTGSAPARVGETAVRVDGIPAGSWAVLAFQDENQNGKLDRNLLGIPSEPYGFSRDARGRFGPPDFSDAAIEVRDDAVVTTVRLR